MKRVSVSTITKQRIFQLRDELDQPTSANIREEMDRRGWWLEDETCAAERMWKTKTINDVLGSAVDEHGNRVCLAIDTIDKATGLVQREWKYEEEWEVEDYQAKVRDYALRGATNTKRAFALADRCEKRYGIGYEQLMFGGRFTTRKADAS